MNKSVPHRRVAAGVLAGLLAFVFSGLPSCALQDALTTPTPVPVTAWALDPVVYQCRVDSGSTGRVVPAGLFGVNLEWINDANGLSNSQGEVGQVYKDALTGGKVDNIRFPGGTFSDYYDWTKGRGTQTNRPVMEHFTDVGKEVNHFGTAEHLKLCASLGVHPFLTANAGTGDAALAADWVDYCNNDSNPLRVADGVPAGTRVDTWEIGNELYYPENPGPALTINGNPYTAASYAAKASGIIDAMRAKDASLRIFAIGTMNPYGVSLPNPGWTAEVLQTLGGKIDGIAIHQAYFPVAFGSTSPGLRIAYETLWSGPDAVAASLEATAVLLDQTEADWPARPLGLAVTEWGPLFPLSSPAWADHQKTLGSAVFVARMFQVFIQARRLDTAQFFKFSDNLIGMGFFDWRQDFKPSWLAFRMYRDFAGTTLVDSTVDSPEYALPATPVLGAARKTKALTSLASLSADGSTLRVNLVNRSWDTRRQVRVDLGGFAAASCTARWITAPGVLDHNGSDVAASIPSTMYEELPLTAGFGGIRDFVTRTLDPAGTVEMPPFSMVNLEYRL